MIPKRQGVSGAMASIPTGTGQLPPIPETPKDGESIAPVASVDTVVVPANSANAILDSLQKFTTVRKKSAVTEQSLQMLKSKGLVSTVGEHVVISEKGLTYLIDFNLIA